MSNSWSTDPHRIPLVTSLHCENWPFTPMHFLSCVSIWGPVLSSHNCLLYLEVFHKGPCWILFGNPSRIYKSSSSVPRLLPPPENSKRFVRHAFLYRSPKSSVSHIYSHATDFMHSEKNKAPIPPLPHTVSRFSPIRLQWLVHREFSQVLALTYPGNIQPNVPMKPCLKLHWAAQDNWERCPYSSLQRCISERSEVVQWGEGEHSHTTCMMVLLLQAHRKAPWL